MVWLRATKAHRYKVRRVDCLEVTEDSKEDDDLKNWTQTMRKIFKVFNLTNKILMIVTNRKRRFMHLSQVIRIKA